MKESEQSGITVNHFNVIDFTNNLVPPNYRGFVDILNPNDVERYYLDIVKRVDPRMDSKEVRYVADGFQKIPIGKYYKYNLSKFTGLIFDPWPLSDWLSRAITVSPNCTDVATYDLLERFGRELITDRGIYEINPKTIVLDFEHPNLAVKWPYKCVEANTPVYHLDGYTKPTIVSYFQTSTNKKLHELGSRRLLMLTPSTSITPAMGYGHSFGYNVVSSYNNSTTVAMNQITGKYSRQVFIEREGNYCYLLDATSPSLAEAINSAQLILSRLQC